MALSRKAEEIVAKAGVPELSRLRLQAGLSFRAIAAALTAGGLPTHHGTVADWEAGRYLPADARLRALARLLRVSADRLEEILLDARVSAARRGA